MVPFLVAPGAMSPISPTLPASLSRRPLPSASACLPVRRTTNTCGSLPWLTTLKVTFPADALARLTLIDHSSSAPVTVSAAVWTGVVDDGERSFELADELLPHPAAK